MSIFSIFSKKNPYEVRLEECLRNAPDEFLVHYARFFRADASAFDPALDLPNLTAFFSADDPRLIQTAATVPEASWKFFRELVTDGGRIVTLSMKNPNEFETATNAITALGPLPYFICEAPDVGPDLPKDDEIPDMTFKFAIAEEVRSTFNRRLRELDRDYAAWSNLWKLACAIVRFLGVCPFDDFIGLARDRFGLALPVHLLSPDSLRQITATLDSRNRFEKGELAVLSDAFVLPGLENMRGVADNIRQRRAAAFADAPSGLQAFVRFAAEHALTDADLHLEDADGKAVRTQTVGRNDPCPCGSGKKFKKCCGR